MPDVLISRPALAGQPVFQSDKVSVEAMAEGHLLQVMGATAMQALQSLAADAGITETRVWPAGYQQWFMAGERTLTSANLEAFTRQLAPGVFVSDQSHGRVRIRVQGPCAAVLISRGTAVDLDGTSFAEGHGAMTLFGHISVHVARTGAENFQLTVLRSFAQSLYEELVELAKAL
ncbi:MAG TPA: sarcosine oxidase subunit gamma [Ensifer sp.]|nr:sarcosine oxidase subunit gamma [Ensifer sp.]